MAHGRFEIRAHAHREFRQTMTRGDVGQQRKMQRGFLRDGRDAHETRRRQTTLSADRLQEGVDLRRRHARLLRLFARVDLDVKARRAPFVSHRLCERPRQLHPIEALNDIEQGDGVAGFVGLQRPDQAQLEVRVCGAARRPSGDRLLDAVFAENPLTGGQGGLNAGLRLHLADGDQGDGGRIAARRAGGGGDSLKDPLAVRGDGRAVGGPGFRRRSGHDGRI